MATSASENNRPETCLPLADEIPVIDPAPPDKSVLARYLVSGVRRILNLRDETDPETLSTAIHAATRRLTAARFLLKDPASSHPSYKPSTPDWLHRAKPENQAAFHEWVRATSIRVFRLEDIIEGPMVPIDTILVKGLTVYAVKNGNTRFYGAWTEFGGNFIGWMRIQPHICGIESDYAVGEVLQMPVFLGITLDLSGHDAVDKFKQALKEVAWDLGVAGG